MIWLVGIAILLIGGWLYGVRRINAITDIDWTDN